MNDIEQYSPNFVDVAEKETVEFDTIDDLLSIPFIEKWRGIGGFHRYSTSSNCLMAEFDEGRRWYVIGYIKYPDSVNLPEWEGKCIE